MEESPNLEAYEEAEEPPRAPSETFEAGDGAAVEDPDQEGHMREPAADGD